MTHPHKTVTVHRLSEAAYDELVKKLPRPVVSNDTSAHNAGFLLGIQHVLQFLREGYVIQTSNSR